MLTTTNSYKKNGITEVDKLPELILMVVHLLSRICICKPEKKAVIDRGQFRLKEKLGSKK